MTINRDHLWMVVALIVGFVIGIYYSKNTGASLVLASLPNAAGATTGTNGTANIPVYGMVTAAQGIGQGG
jgi:hypothetical protein